MHKNHQLANRLRILCFVIPALIIGVIFWVGSIITGNIADEAAANMSRRYSMEAASNFQRFTIRQMQIMEQMANSTAIARWLANEDDHYAKIAAFDAMTGHSAALPDAFHVFTVQDTWHTYIFSVHRPFESFVPRDLVEFYNVEDMWYADLQESELPFALNIQRGYTDAEGNWELYIWINRRVYYGGRAVGIFTIGSPFTDIFEATFGGFCAEDKRGYIIDRNGMVRLESTGTLQTQIDGLPTPPSVPETEGNPALTAAINSHMQMLDGGSFPPGAPTAAATRLEGAYMYASITPIVGTDWSIMVLSTQDGGFDTRFIPLVFVVVVLLVLFVIIGGVMVHRMVIAPQQILNIVNQAAQMLLTSGMEDWEAAARSMEIVGLSVDADRIRLWKNELIDGEMQFVLRYNWTRNETISKTAGLGAGFKYSVTPGWLRKLKNGETIAGLVKDFEPENRDFFTKYDVKSFVLVPLFINNEYHSAISVSDCTRERDFTKEQLEMFASVGLMLTNSLIRNEQAEETRRRELAEESNRAKSRFLARMSHEIRTPITSVLGISEIQLRSPALSPNMEEAFAKIYDSAQLLLNIVNDVLDFSKIESGNMNITCEEYEVASLANDAAQLYMVYMEHKNINFKMTVDEQLPIYMVGDVLRIRQIINNLLSNAFKYTEVGGVSFSLSCEKQGDTNVMLKISIQDTGYGMSREQLETVRTKEYSRFYEGEERVISGTGLGLPIVYSLVQMMNGQIEFNSEVGNGTDVAVCIPQQSRDNGVIGKEMAESLQKFESFSPKKIKFTPEPMPYGKVLVVDDVDANLFVARGLLAFYDLSVETCNSGYEALGKIEQGFVYDIIFMDSQMPGLTGTETMHAMRDMGYGGPIVVLTANALLGQAEEFIGVGFDDFISKPIETSRLNEILKKYISGKQAPNPEAGDGDDFLCSPEIMEKLRRDFAKNHKQAFAELCQALESGDIAAARRLAHTIKGVAALINEDALAQAAMTTESLLSEGTAPSAPQIAALENEFNNVLKSITIPENPLPYSNEERQGIIGLINKIKPLLESKKSDSLELSDKLKTIPEAAIFVKQMERFEFKQALESLNTLLEILD